MAEENSILGGRVLGTKEVANSVLAFGKEIKSVIAAMEQAKKEILGTARDASNGRRASDRSGGGWNNSTHSWGSNGGVGSLAQARQAQFGLQPMGAPLTLPPSPNNNGGYSSTPSIGMGTRVLGAAAGLGLAAGSAAMNWSKANMSSMSTAEQVGITMNNNGGWGSRQSAITQGTLIGSAAGLGRDDQIAASMYATRNLGQLGNNGGYKQSVQYASMLNPSMAATTGVGIQSYYNSPQASMLFRGLGVNTIGAAGSMRPSMQTNESILARGGVNRAMTADQIKATFRDPRSPFMQSLQSLGVPDEVIQGLADQGAREAQVRAAGGDVNRFQALMGASKPDKSAIHKEFGYVDGIDSILQSQKAKDAAITRRDIAGLPAFSKGVQTASDRIVGFNHVLENFMKSPFGQMFSGGAGILGSLGGGGIGGAIGTGINTAAAYKILRGGRSAAGKVGEVAEKAPGAVGGIGAALGAVGAVGGLLYPEAKSYFKDPNLGHHNPLSVMAGGSVGLAVRNATHQVQRVGGWIGGLFGGDADESGGPNDGPTAQQVVSRAKAAASSGTNFGYGHCQRFVRTCLGSPGGADSAAAAWAAAKYKHAADPNPPAGACVFWLGGSHGYGHVAVSAGGGNIYSTDVGKPGRVSATTVQWINQHWRSLRYVGWSEDNNGIRVQVGGSFSVSNGSGTDGSTGSTAYSGTSGATSGATLAGGAYGSINSADALANILSGSAPAFAAPANSDANALTGSSGRSNTPHAPTSVTGNKAIVKNMAASMGWTGDQWDALYQVIQHESHFNNNAKNPDSSAFGIFQMLKYKNPDPRQQTVDGLKYISSRYGDPIHAWSFWQKNKHYQSGAYKIPEDQSAIVHKGEMIIPAGQAETIRQALIKDSLPSQSNGGGLTLMFGENSMKFHVTGSMDEKTTRKMAKDFGKYLSENEDIKRLAKGR